MPEWCAKASRLRPGVAGSRRMFLASTSRSLPLRVRFTKADRAALRFQGDLFQIMMGIGDGPIEMRRRIFESLQISSAIVENRGAGDGLRYPEFECASLSSRASRFPRSGPKVAAPRCEATRGALAARNHPSNAASMSYFCRTTKIRREEIVLTC